MRDGCDAVSFCRAAVRQLIDRFDWRLLPEEEFVAGCVRTLTEKPAMIPKQACLNVYSRELYDACQDVCRQEQAYQGLHDYLYRTACYRRPEVAEDAVQEALRLIFEQIDTCRNPGAFLCFARFKLLQAIKIVDRPLGVEPPYPPLPEPSPEDLMLSDVEMKDLFDCMRQVWETHPRASNQLRAVLWKYIDELSDEEIAERLKKTPAQVHVLRSRGMKKLRQCMAERGYVVDRRLLGS
jgi:DNA-directed RNA polymerase specialized sigma24 family protein